MLRTEIRASSPLCRASLTYSLRRSSVSSGSETRIRLPSLVGFTPRSESRRDFSIAAIEVLSYGVIRMVRASGVWNDASCCSGVGEP